MCSVRIVRVLTVHSILYIIVYNNILYVYVYIYFFLNTVCIVRLRIYIAKSDEECNPNRYYHVHIKYIHVTHLLVRCVAVE